MAKQNSKKYMNILSKVIGKYDSISGSDYDYWCPFCKDDDQGHLHVNFYKGKALCHRCGYAAGSLKKLLQDLRIDLSEVEEYVEKIPAIGKFIKDLWKAEKKRKAGVITLPDEYNVLRVRAKDLMSKMYLGYLRRYRGLSIDEISSIPIGYCSEGRYAGRLVFPTYMFGKLVYFTTRAVLTGKPKSLHPENTDKNYILYGVDWLESTNHIFLVEGVFDTFAFRNKSLAVFGHSLSHEHVAILRKLRAKEITVCFDADVPVAQITRLCKFIAENTESTVSFMQLDTGDPFDNRHTIQRFIDRRIIYNQRQSLHNQLKELFVD